jgi:hypothetical protein
MLIVGMASCIALRTDAAIAAIWTGTVAGTALGHGLALFNTRTWFALLTILTTAAVVGPSAPGELSGSTLWLAFIPAAACAYWSLGDRTTLIAFWFPAVIWMLSILDHAQANGVPDNTGILLLGVLAILFLVFLRVRETRRVALWSTVAAPATTLAQPKRNVVLKERPGFRLARTGWALIASALAFGATAWVAPQLWRAEELPGEHARVATDPVAIGLPCCPVETTVVVPKARVKEYFSIGRGQDQDPIAEQPDFSCRRCEAPGVAVADRYDGIPYGYGYSYGTDPGPYIATGPAEPTTYFDTTGDPRVTPTVEWSGDPIANAVPPPVVEPTPTPWVAGSEIRPPASVSDRLDEPAPIVPPAVVPDEPAPQAAAAPVIAASEPQQPAPPSPAPQVAPSEPQQAAPSPAPAAATHDDVAHAGTTAPRTAPNIGPSLIQWIGIVLAAALLMQLAALALRPLRRYVTLRHLRRPYWEETVDQRVSNAWQLALVGLRDAGWRADSQESPRELARRVGIDGVERCASILERARHGIGIDADDLSTMTASAESAYRDARERLGTVARATTWLRWPLT